MIRHFCDCCSKELSDENSRNRGRVNRLFAEVNRSGHNLKFEIITSKDGVSNAGDFCDYCILDALISIDDRKTVKHSQPSSLTRYCGPVTDAMVTRFLGWKLPEDFQPDGGITFKRWRNEHMPWGGNKNEPIGTNLLTADQARSMLTHVMNTEDGQHNGMVDVIAVEKLLCDKLGVQWSATGMSIESLVDRLIEKTEH